MDSREIKKQGKLRAIITTAIVSSKSKGFDRPQDLAFEVLDDLLRSYKITKRRT